MGIFRFWSSVGWLIVLGTVAIAFINIINRAIMKKKCASPLQFLVLWYATTTVLFGTIYILFWGLNAPDLLPGFWIALGAGVLVGLGIHFCEARAATIDAGETSLTAPFQAMTPGLIAIVALTLGEFPSKLGILGIFFMASGSWILLVQKKSSGVYEYLGPLRQLRFLLPPAIKRKINAGPLPLELKNKALAVRLSIISACMGTFGLLMDGLYTRRAVTLQGLALACMVYMASSAVLFLFWYLIKNDATPEQKRGALSFFIKYPGLLLLLGISTAWIAHVFLILPAFSSTYVAYVGTLKRLSIIISVILGRILLGEGQFRKRFLAACLVLFGAILISTDDLPTLLSVKIEGFGF
ncbi:MAG: hypothetical protein HYX20_03160 [Candidatus Yanofskybacteria bacterium]|nr:hypothetical protein [Candidatus Yanofskybacteria bacterium]